MHVFHTYIIPNGLVVSARAKVTGVEHLPGIAGMFTAALSSTGNLPATHYASSGWMSPEEVAYLDANLPRAFDESDGTFNGEPEGVHQMITRLGLKLINIL